MFFKRETSKADEEMKKNWEVILPRGNISILEPEVEG